MIFVVIGLVAAFAAFLTLFSGFGLGTLLLPAFGWFFPPAAAVAMTACVHFGNNLAKLLYFARHADKKVLLRFGIPAWIFAGGGAWLLGALQDSAPLTEYSIADHRFFITPLGLGLGGVMVLFAVLEMMPAFAKVQFPEKWLPLGGLLSGFFGGLSGHQGALRSAFLIKSGLSKEAFIGTGVVLACGVDAVRMAVYGIHGIGKGWQASQWGLVAFAMGCAWLGVALGARQFKKITFPALQKGLAFLLGFFGLAWMGGLL